MQLHVRILQGLGSDYALYLQPSGHMEHLSPSEELYEKLLHCEIFLNHEEAKRTTVISAPIAQTNNQAPSRNGINLKLAAVALSSNSAASLS